MRPRKRREEMTPERVIPGWTKRRDHTAIIFQQPSHDPQYLPRIIEMLESVERQDHVRFFIGARRERTSIRNAALSRRRARFRQRALANINSDHFPRPTQRDLNRILAI